MVNLKSKEQLLGEIVRKIRNNTDINDFKKGGALVTALEAITQQMYSVQVDVLKVLEMTDLDSLEGTRLDDLAQSIKISNGVGGIGREPALQASGNITIGSAFEKISTRSYAGKPAPFAGSTTLFLQDASQFTPSGQLYIGRNTVDSFEGPINYTAISFTGSYYEVTLAGPLTKDHAYGDEVTLAQGGDRTVQAGTVVQVPANADNDAVLFTINQTVTIPDGEAETSVGVTANNFGQAGNASALAIKEFVGQAPFTGATVINLLAFVNGSDTESDPALRQRIRDYPNTLARGTVGAISAALKQVQDSETKTSVTSVNVIRPIQKGDPTIAYIDDGSVLQPEFIGQDYELLLAQASGLEQSFRTAQAPITPAIALGAAIGPFSLEVGQTVTFIVDNVPYIYPNSGGIQASNYKDILAATPYEIIRDFNSLPDSPLEFRVYNAGRSIVAIDKTNQAEEISVSSGALQKTLGLSTDIQRPIYLYKNAILQSFRGKTATIATNAFSSWNIQSSYTGLVAEIDGVTVSIADITTADFAQFSSTIQTATADQWQIVLQSKIPGATVVFQNGQFIISSNKENSSSSQIKIVSGNWIGNNSLFDTSVESVGSDKDYDFNRYTGDIRFVKKLTAGDIIEIASENTRAYIESTTTTIGLYDLSAQVPGFGNPRFVVAFDGTTAIKVPGTLSNAALQVISSDASSLLVELQDLNANGIFTNAEIGDYLYLTRNTDATITTPIPPAAEGIYKIKQINRTSTGNDSVIIEVSDTQQAAFVVSTVHEATIAGIINLFSSTTIPQIIEIENGSTNTTVEDVVDEINQKIVGGAAYRIGAKFFRVRSNTFNGGTTTILASLGNISSILKVGFDTSLQAHIANSASAVINGGFPVVTASLGPVAGSVYGARNYLEVYKNFTDMDAGQNPAIEASVGVTDYPVGFQETWITGKLTGWTGRTYNNETVPPFSGFERSDKLVPPVGPITTTTTTKDRYSNISFKLEDIPVTNFDKFVVEMDLDPENKTVTVPMYKLATIESMVSLTSSGKGKTIEFTLKDPEDSDKPFFDPTSSYKDFDFNDFKILTKSVGVYQSDTSAPSDLAVVLRSSTFGGASRYRLILNLPQSPAKSEITVAHSSRFNDDEVETIVTAELCSQATTTGSNYDAGTYAVSSVTTPSPNLRDVTISTSTPAISANANIQAFTLNAIPGANKNGVIVTIKDSGNDGSPMAATIVAETVNSFSTFDLNGDSPLVADVNTLFSSSLNMQNATTTLPLVALDVGPSGPGYQANIAASMINPGGNIITFTMTQAPVSPRAKGEQGNNWTLTVNETAGAGSPSVSRSGTDITIDIFSSTPLLLTDVAALLNTLPGGPYVTVTGAGPGNLTPFTILPFNGGVDESNTMILAGGADATSGAFGVGYVANALIQIGGTQSSTSMPIGTFPIVSASAGNVTFRIPYYYDVNSIVGNVYQASAYPVQSYLLDPKTAQDIADAINDYLPDSPVATAEAIGTGITTVNFIQPNPANLPRPTYINYTKTSALPTNITSPSSAYLHHAFDCNFGGTASIYNYDSSDAIYATVQNDDSIFPDTTQSGTTSYTPVNEQVYLVPTNTSTIERWMQFPPTSSLTVSANVERSSNASSVQISSKQIGSDGAVYAKSTAANDTNIVVSGAAAPDGSSSYISVLTSQARSVPRRSMVQINNAVTTDLLRPFRASPLAANITAANTTNITSWVRPNSRVRYEKASGAITGRMYFLRNGQAAFSFSGAEPLSDGTVTVAINTPSSGFATLTLSGSTGELSARVGDMLYVKPGSDLSVYIPCANIGTGSKVMSAVMYGKGSNPQITAYPGYTVVNVTPTTVTIIANSDTGIVTAGAATINSSTDLVFVPVLFTEKNIRTNFEAGPTGAEIVQDIEGNGVHAQPYQYGGNDVDFYAILKKLNGPFYALIASNTVEQNSFTDLPSSSFDDLLLEESVVNSDDYVYLKGFGSSQDGEYKLVAHDGTNTMILYRAITANDMIQSTVQDSSITPYTRGLAQWGKKVQPLVVNGQNGDITAATPNVTLNVAGGSNGLQVGDSISGIGIPNGTTIASINYSLDTLVMSQNATITNSSVALQFSRPDTINYGYNPSEYDVDPRPIRIVDAESVMIGSYVKISQAVTGTTKWFPQSILGSWKITDIGYYAANGPEDICQYIEFEVPTGAPANNISSDGDISVGSANVENIGFVEREPFVGFRFVQGFSQDPIDLEFSQLYVSPSKSSQKISDAYGSEIDTQFKLGYETSPLTGIDGYKIFGGLIREAHRTVDGVPSSIQQFNGVKSSGTDVSVLPPVPRSVAVVFKIKTRDGVSVNVLAQVIRSSVATFISQLGIGVPVVLSDLITVVQQVPGVTSVEITSTTPTAVDAVIPVGDNETAVVIDPNTDIEVGQ